MTTPQDDAARLVSDPGTPGAVLAQIAYERPDLRVAVAAHPGAYAGLLGWLESYGDPAVVAAVAARRGQQAPSVGATGAPSVQRPDLTAAPGAPAGAWLPGPAVARPESTAGEVPATGAAGTQSGYGTTSGYGTPSAYVTPSSFGTPGSAGTFGGSGAFGAQPTVGPGGFGAGSGQGGQYLSAFDAHTAPRRSRKGLWIGLVAGVLVLVAGGTAAYGLYFSKLGGAKSPEAAVSSLLDAAEKKDAVGVYGLLSPAEVGSFAQLSNENKAGSTSTPSAAVVSAARDAAAAITIDISGVTTSSETVGEGVAKVTLTGGTMKIDADEAKLTDALVTLAGSQATQYGMSGQWDEATVRKQIKTSLTDVFPISTSAGELTVAGANGRSAPFVMAVKEGSAWFVSPLLTIGEYMSVANGTPRGTLIRDADVAHYATPEAAASGMATALAAYATTGDSAKLVGSLPLAERRFVSLYAPLGADPLAKVDLTSSTFDVRETKGDTAWLTIGRLAAKITASDGSGLLEVTGLCAKATGDVGSESLSGCLTDVPAAAALGAKDIALVAVKESTGWHVSVLATLTDLTGVVAKNIQSLVAEGKFQDPQWVQDTFGSVLGLVTGASGNLAVPSSADDSGYVNGVDLTPQLTACSDGDMAACDKLTQEVGPGESVYELGATCGYLGDSAPGTCVARFGA